MQTICALHFYLINLEYFFNMNKYGLYNKIKDFFLQLLIQLLRTFP